MNGVDYSPLVGVANAAIATFASTATLALPIIGYFVIQWLRSHIAQNKQATATLAAGTADSLLHKGLDYAKQVGADPVQGAVAYAVVQAPDVLKNLGFDPATASGLESIRRMAVARLPVANAKTKA